ncbi:unnamed protein product [Owenia fusiformis]|uniref:Uncharacterized protein n=1 Tax=Owenia fusiformis TaxID=6347 RepID=A0A8J1TYL1_OWEFU|nr:unnamed protein product [Owenia fusiformis]
MRIINVSTTLGYNVSTDPTYPSNITEEIWRGSQPWTTGGRSEINSTKLHEHVLFNTTLSNISMITTAIYTQNMQDKKDFGEPRSAASTLLLPSLFGIFVMFSLILVTICARRQRKNILSQWRKEQLGSYTRGMGWTAYTPNTQSSPGSTVKLPKPNHTSSHPLADSAKRYLNSMIKKTSGRNHGRTQSDGEMNSPRPGHSGQSTPLQTPKLSLPQDNSTMSTNV